MSTADAYNFRKDDEREIAEMEEFERTVDPDGATESRTLLVIGGSGFLSGAVVRYGLAQGYSVWTLTRGRRPVPAGATSLVADRADAAAFAQAIDQAGVRWDLVVDCIGFAPRDVRQDLDLFASTARHLVFVSTDFVYDPARRRIPQAEESDSYLADGYGGQKRRCEQALSEADAGDLRWTIVRPCHIYGPGSQLGCLPLHGRDPQLLSRLQAGEPLRLVGGGYFLQQPVFVDDLAQTILGLGATAAADRQIFCVAGPEIVESREYYRLIAEALGTRLTIEEVAVDAYLRDHPEAAPFLCHRVYDLRKLQQTGAFLPQTPLEAGLRAHVASLLAAPAAR
jgi:nucleoside-diphosphate-sugar epimerase